MTSRIIVTSSLVLCSTAQLYSVGYTSRSRDGTRLSQQSPEEKEEHRKRNHNHNIILTQINRLENLNDFTEHAVGLN